MSDDSFLQAPEKVELEREPVLDVPAIDMTGAPAETPEERTPGQPRRRRRQGRAKGGSVDDLIARIAADADALAEAVREKDAERKELAERLGRLSQALD